MSRPIAVEEKAEKTVKAIDDLTAKRKKRTEQINEPLREQRRATLAQSRQTAMTNPANARGARGRAPAGNTGAAGYSMGNPYANPTAKTPPRRPADANQPPIDPNTQAQIQAWLNAKADDKKALLQTVDDLNLTELQSLQELALKEQAKKTSVALLSLMMLREQRAEKITLGWQEEDARMQKLQERYGPNWNAAESWHAAGEHSNSRCSQAQEAAVEPADGRTSVRLRGLRLTLPPDHVLSCDLMFALVLPRGN